MRQLKFLLHFLTLISHWALNNGAATVNVDGGTERTEAHMMKELRTWLDETINGPLPKYCHGPSEDQIKVEEYLVRPAPCHEKEAIRSYDFDGTFVNGKLNGSGILTISKDKPPQQRCIIVKSSVFDLPFPDKIEGDFEDGFVFGIANLTWSDLNIKMTAHMSYGMIHGMFKAHDRNQNKWMVSSAVRNQLSDVNKLCWLVDHQGDHVISTACNGLFQINTENTDNIVNLFLFNMTLLLQGKIVGGNPSKLLERDATLKNIMKGACDQNVYAEVQGPHYEFDLSTGQRKLYDFSYQDLCNGTDSVEGDKVPEFLKIYLTKALKLNKPAMLEEKNPINYDKFPTKLLSNLRKNPNKPEIYDATFNLYKELEITFEHRGNLDEHGKFHGFTALKIVPSKSCIKGTCDEDDIGTIKGTFNHGNIDGIVTITSPDESQTQKKDGGEITMNKKSKTEGSIQQTFIPTKDGIAHGIVTTFGLKQLYRLREKYPADFTRKSPQNHIDLSRLAKFENGKLTNDFAWQVLIGYPDGQQSFMYGHFDNDGKMSSDNTAYIYPGAKLALVGKFKSNIMLAGQSANILQATCKDNLVSLKFSEPEGPKFHLSIGTNNTVGDMPLVRDPYEVMTIKLGKSLIPDSGEGIFAVRDIKAYELLALYNGYQLVGVAETSQHNVDCHNGTWPHNMTKPDELTVRRKCFKNKLHSLFGSMLDMPPWWDPRENYTASLAHMINNKFDPFTNSKFGAMEHPRFGPIETVWATKDIAKGAELFLDYGYSKLPSSGSNELYPWHNVQLLKHKEYLQKMEAGEDMSQIPIP